MALACRKELWEHGLRVAFYNLFRVGLQVKECFKQKRTAGFHEETTLGNATYYIYFLVIHNAYQTSCFLKPSVSHVNFTTEPSFLPQLHPQHFLTPERSRVAQLSDRNESVRTTYLI